MNKNTEYFKIAAILLFALLLCSICFNITLGLYALDRTIRVNELEGPIVSPLIYPNPDRPTQPMR